MTKKMIVKMEYCKTGLPLTYKNGQTFEILKFWLLTSQNAEPHFFLTVSWKF